MPRFSVVQVMMSKLHGYIVFWTIVYNDLYREKESIPDFCTATTTYVSFVIEVTMYPLDIMYDPV